MIANAQGKNPTKFDCKLFEGQQKLDARILFDPTISTVIYGSKETFIVTNERAKIVFKASHLDLQGIENAVSTELLTKP